MSVPRQQPHAIAKFKHQARTAVPKPVTVPAHMVPYDDWRSVWEWDYWPDGPGAKRQMPPAEMKRHKARAARKARK